MKYGMNLLLWATHVTDEHMPVIEKIKRVGFDGVEIPIFAGDEAHYRKLGQDLNRLGLGCSAVTIATPEANPSSADAAVRRAAVDRLKWALDNAAALGADVLCGPYHQPLGLFTGNGATEEEKSRLADVLRQGAEHAATRNVRIGIEYLNRFECYMLNTGRDTAEMVRRVNHPNFGMMYDTFHANIEEKNPPAVIQEVGRHIVHVHISENDRGTPGTGHVQWAETFRALRAINYDGWMTIEAFGRALPDLAAATRVWRDLFPTPDEVLEKGLAFMKNGWAGAR